MAGGELREVGRDLGALVGGGLGPLGHGGVVRRPSRRLLDGALVGQFVLGSAEAGLLVLLVIVALADVAPVLGLALGLGGSGLVLTVIGAGRVCGLFAAGGGGGRGVAGRLFGEEGVDVEAHALDQRLPGRQLCKVGEQALDGAQLDLASAGEGVDVGAHHACGGLLVRGDSILQGGR